jgi:hypothetical protein
MKVIKEKGDRAMVAVTFRLPKPLMDQMTRAAKRNNISRQRLVAAILEQVVGDKGFVLKIREN